jgi:hypothetical protein
MRNPRAVAHDPLVEVERRIKAAVYTPVAALAATAWVTPEPVSYARRRDGRELLLVPGDRWSEAVFDCAWFQFTGTVPAAAAGKDVVLLIDINGEGCVVDEAGRPRLGLTNISSTFDRKHGNMISRCFMSCCGCCPRPARGRSRCARLWCERRNCCRT